MGARICVFFWTGHLQKPIAMKFITRKKYVLSNSESVQCNFFIFDHVTFIQFNICCCVQNFIEIEWFFAEIWRYIDFSKWRPSAILELFYHHTRPPTKSLLLAAADCQISCQSDTQIWRYSCLNFSHIWLEMPIQFSQIGVLGDFEPITVIIHYRDPKRHILA